MKMTRLDLTLDDYIEIGKESKESRNDNNDNYVSQDRSTQFNNCTFNFCKEPKTYSSHTHEYEEDDDYICPNILYDTGEYCKEYCYDCEKAGAKYPKDTFSPFHLGLPLGLAIAPFFYTFKGLGIVTKLLLTPRIINTSSDDTIIDTEIIDTKEPQLENNANTNMWQKKRLEHQVEMAKLEKEYQQLLTEQNAQKIVRMKMNKPDNTNITKTHKNSVFELMKNFKEGHNEE
jgi:hypothetical protein